MCREKLTVLGHTSKIFFNLSVATMIVCYIAPVVFAYDIMRFLGVAFLIFFLGGIWIALALVGVVTALLALDSYRAFLSNLGSFVLGLINGSSNGQIMSFLVKISPYYPILAVLTSFNIIMFFTVNLVMHNIRNNKNQVIIISIMSVLFVISIVFSSILISRLRGAVL